MKEETMNDLHKILTNQAEQWAMLGAPALCERFIARNGQCFEGRKLPKGFRRGTPKACFQNATLLADRHTGLRYVEGYAMNPDLPFPFLHAWCINVAGQVVDVTLKEPEKYQYVGIILTRKELWDALKASGIYGVLDTGRGLNHEWMFARDLELEPIIRAIPDNWNAMRARALQ
jgi:hypothetical protein